MRRRSREGPILFANDVMSGMMPTRSHELVQRDNLPGETELWTATRSLGQFRNNVMSIMAALSMFGYYRPILQRPITRSGVHDPAPRTGFVSRNRRLWPSRARRRLRVVHLISLIGSSMISKAPGARFEISIDGVPRTYRVQCDTCCARRSLRPLRMRTCGTGPSMRMAGRLAGSSRTVLRAPPDRRW
jgi:hypothetical protein